MQGVQNSLCLHKAAQNQEKTGGRYESFAPSGCGVLHVRTISSHAPAGPDVQRKTAPKFMTVSTPMITRMMTTTYSTTLMSFRRPEVFGAATGG